jgi:NADH-quinone oxidoreductase subunit E
MLSEETKAKIEKETGKYPSRAAATKSALRYAQEENGWITDDVVTEVADLLAVEPIRVYEVATFYDMFYTEPVGRHQLRVCTNVSCMLRGSGEIVDYLKDKLGVGFGETTEDGRFTLLEAECLSACGGAPMLMCGDHYFECLTRARIDELLDSLD